VLFRSRLSKAEQGATDATTANVNNYASL
jgi:hypothetical protein